MTEYRFDCVLRSDADVGEGPAWNVEDQCLYWVDIHKCNVNRFDPATGVNRTWDLPSEPGCLVFRDGGGAIIPARDGVYDFDFSTGEMNRILAPPYDPTIYRFNDGKCDRQGRLWVGTMPLDLKDLGTFPGALYRYDGTTLEARLQIEMSNGTAFSPDGRTMYRAETRQRIIYAYDFDPVAGALSREREFTRIPPGTGAPDGATVDTEGGYWVAVAAGPNGGAIARYTPDGKLDLRIETPVPAPAMVNFGGPDMSTLYVTSSRFDFLADRPGQELSGSIFTVDTGFTGVPEPRFKGVG